MEINQIYVNLPVKDVQKTREFWTKLGFSINEQFSDEKAICVIMKQDHIYTMFLKKSFSKLSQTDLLQREILLKRFLQLV